MTQQKHDYAVFIGRFQPFHAGHQHVVDTALQFAKKVIVIVGGNNRSRSIRNPFTFEERRNMIRSFYNDTRVLIVPANDFMYQDDKWTAHIQKVVHEAILNDVNKSEKAWNTGLNDLSITLIGHSKDHSSYYLKMFPQWYSIDVEQFDTYNATEIRERAFNGDSILHPFRYQEVINQLRPEYEYIRDYKKMWENTPFPVIFSTVDAVVIQSGHILLVERGELPGKGLLALPGGFIHPDETLMNAAIRELKEETRIADARGEIPKGVLRSFIRDDKTRTFDDPHRSNRGRTITTAFYFDLPDKTELYKVKGADDAKHAFWLPIGEIDPRKMFEDHYAIIQCML